MKEQHTVHLPVVRYWDAAGNPTCAADFQTGDVCKFYRKHLRKLAMVLQVSVTDLIGVTI